MKPQHVLDTVALRMTELRIHSGLQRMVLVFALLLPLASAAADQRTFPTPEAAVAALISAFKANDEAALVAIFGTKHKDVVSTGDAAHDSARRAEFAQHLATFHALDERAKDRRVLLIGARAWPSPIPLVLEQGGWRFATEEGAEEIINRRIGRNERNAILVLRTYIEAQRQYAARDRHGDGVLQYAQKISSAPGKYDGLYWPADASKNEEVSPFGPLIAGASAYVAGRKQGDPYRGYYFRILTRQGKSAPGGAYSYIINGRMIAGFAMVAYPADYEDTGIMTFIVSHNGKVYERDLGKGTASIGANMAEFDPGPGWKEVKP